MTRAVTSLNETRSRVAGIIIPRPVKSELERLYTASSILQREMGGVLCHDIRGDKMVIRDVVQVSGSLLQESSYSYNTGTVDLVSRFFCSNPVPVMFHTHPSGNPAPSMQDRMTSSKLGTVGCIVAGSRMSCYKGQHDIPILD